MNIVETIKSIGQTVNPNGTVANLTTWEYNVQADSDSMPVIYFEVVKESGINRGGALFKRWRVNLLFACLSELTDYTDDEGQKTVKDEMDALADAFYKQAGTEEDTFLRPLFREVISIDRYPVQNWSDVNLSGIFVSLELEELLPYARC